MGASATFDDAIGEFAMEYADQNERDYRGFVTAVKDGRIETIADVLEESPRSAAQLAVSVPGLVSRMTTERG